MGRIKYNNLKVVTVNVTEESLEEINKMINNDKIYASRSELIRVAVRDWLKKKLNFAIDELKYASYQKKLLDPEKFVQVPHDNIDAFGQVIKEFKTYNRLREA